MTKSTFGMFALAALSAGALCAQDITGTWQGTLVLPNKQELRTVYKISKDGAAQKCAMYSIDQTPQAIACSVTLTGPNLKISIPGIAGALEGKLDSDGVNFTGNFVQGGGAAIPITLKHLGPNDPAWPMPEEKAPPKQMTDPNPEFDAVSIKPSDPGIQGRGLTVRGREVVTINTTVSYLMTFVYDVSPKQIVGGPSWIDSAAFNLDGKPTAEGIPNQKQLKIMFEKLLADRFQLKFHKEKREMSAYVIQTGKNGPKMTVSQFDPKGLPGLFFRALGALNSTNATMKDLASLLQTAVLDRPVVDQSGLDGHYDFALNWTPDETQFAGIGMKVPPPSDKPDAPPDLVTAMMDQLGLKLTVTKVPVDVLVIDKLEKPSAN